MVRGELRRGRALSWVLAVLLPAAATGVGMIDRDVVDSGTDVALYFLAVVGVGLAGGVAPALFASALAGVALNLFFTRPYYSLDIHRTADLVALIAMVLVAVTVAVLVDRVTAAQSQVESARLRTALLSALGHDLRSPLTSIKAAVGGLRDRTVTLQETDRAELLETIEESTDRLVWVAENLLDASRLATGAVSPQLRPVSYEDVVGRALWTVEGSGDVTVELPVDLPAVLADAGLLERAVANVVDNAVRHAKGSAVVIRAAAHTDRVELRVRDAGPGIVHDKAESMFAPFHRLGDRDAATGLGLGLSVTKGFVEAMDGAVHAEDTPGGGLTIVISLPAWSEQA